MQPDSNTDDVTSKPEPNAGEMCEPSNQEIFEQTFNDLMNGFGQQCEQHDIQRAIAIAKHSDFEEPLVFYRAPHIVEAAALMAQVLRQVKNELYSDLDTDKKS